MKRQNKFTRAAIFDLASKFCLFSCCPGRAFLRRLIDLTCGVKNQQDVTDLLDETKADIDTWIAYFN